MTVCFKVVGLGLFNSLFSLLQNDSSVLLSSAKGTLEFLSNLCQARGVSLDTQHVS